MSLLAYSAELWHWTELRNFQSWSPPLLPGTLSLPTPWGYLIPSPNALAAWAPDPLSLALSWALMTCKVPQWCAQRRKRRNIVSLSDPGFLLWGEGTPVWKMGTVGICWTHGPGGLGYIRGDVCKPWLNLFHVQRCVSFISLEAPRGWPCQSQLLETISKDSSISPTRPMCQMAEATTSPLA